MVLMRHVSAHIKDGIIMLMKKHQSKIIMQIALLFYVIMYIIESQIS